MNEQLKLVLIIAGCAAGVLLALWGIWYLRVRIQRKKGVYLKNKVHTLLSRFASIRNFKALKDVDIEVDGKKAHFDNVLVGFFGLILIDCLPRRGEYYGALKDEKWIYIQGEKEKGGKKEYFKNPLTQIVEDVDVLRTAFAKNNVFKMQMEYLIIVEPSVKKTVLYLSPNLPVLRPKTLKKLIHRVKYDKDNNVDVQQIVGLIEQYSVK